MANKEEMERLLENVKDTVQEALARMARAQESNDLAGLRDAKRSLERINEVIERLKLYIPAVSSQLRAEVILKKDRPGAFSVEKGNVVVAQEPTKTKPPEFPDDLRHETKDAQGIPAALSEALKTIEEAIKRIPIHHLALDRDKNDAQAEPNAQMEESTTVPIATKEEQAMSIVGLGRATKEQAVTALDEKKKDSRAAGKGGKKKPRKGGKKKPAGKGGKKKPRKGGRTP